jgi:hypothetical protein
MVWRITGAVTWSEIPNLAFALRNELGEQLRDDRYVANLVAAQAEAACDVFERGPAEHSQAIVDTVGAQLEPYPPSFIAQIRMR